MRASFSCLFALSLVLAPFAIADDKLPFAAEVLIERYEVYQKDIQQKAAKVIADKRAETIANLKSEAARQKRTGNNEAAAQIVRKIAEVHNGSAHVCAPAGGKGCSVQVRLPQKSWIN